MDLPSLPVSLALALHLLAVITLWGTLLFLHQVAGSAQAILEPWCRRLCGVCLAAAALGMGLWLSAAAAQMIGADQPFVADPMVLSQLLQGSQFGTIWLLRMGTLLLLAVMIWLRPSGRSLAVEALPWAGVLLLSLAMTGHGGAAVGARRLLLPLVALHLAAVGAWVGSLPPLARLAALDDEQALRAVLERYRRFGLIAVSVLAVSGIASVALLSEGHPLDWDLAWPRILAVKFALVAGMLTLGAINRFVLGPKLKLRLIRLSVVIEYSLALLVVLAAALLSQSPPPG